MHVLSRGGCHASRLLSRITVDVVHRAGCHASRWLSRITAAVMHCACYRASRWMLSMRQMYISVGCNRKDAYEKPRSVVCVYMCLCVASPSLSHELYGCLAGQGWGQGWKALASMSFYVNPARKPPMPSFCKLVLGQRWSLFCINPHVYTHERHPIPTQTLTPGQPTCIPSQIPGLNPTQTRTHFKTEFAVPNPLAAEALLLRYRVRLFFAFAVVFPPC